MAFSSIPAGIFWLIQKFIPTQNALQYFPEIINSALQTVLLAITATTISAIFALFLAIIGSNSTGINIFTKIITKVIASFFRNMPIVAWSLILVFSFKQSQFTGFLALFLITFGYLTRAFSETIDDIAGDVIEAKFTGVDRKARVINLSVRAKAEAEESAAIAQVNKQEVEVPSAMAAAFAQAKGE